MNRTAKNAQEFPEGNLTVLVGNGLTIALNSDLTLKRITEEAFSAIQDDSGDDVAKVMQALAERVNSGGEGGADSDFEALVGAFGFEARNLGMLGEIADSLDGVSDKSLAAAIEKTRKFSNEVQMRGISHVLEYIDDHAKLQNSELEEIRKIVGNLVNSFPKGNITFANLNYDSILMQGLAPNYDELADMADGSQSQEIDLFGTGPLTAYSMRVGANFPKERRIRLVHLHGSLTFWECEDGAGVVKVKKKDVSEAQPWGALRTGASNVRPCVVLAKPEDKPEIIKESPYYLAYEVFEDALGSADGCVVIGYSFRDDSVNRRIHSAILERSIRSLLVVGTSSITREVVLSNLGLIEDELDEDFRIFVDQDGAVDFTSHDQWKEFKESLGQGS